MSQSSSSLLYRSMLLAPRHQIRRNLRSWRTRRILVTRLSILTDYNQVRAYFNGFGAVDELRFITARNWRYTKSCVVTMRNLAHASQILRQAGHIIDGATVEVNPHRGFADIRPLLVKGDNRVRITGLQQGEHEEHLNRIVEDALRAIAPHTLITIRKNDDMTTDGQADVWFVQLNDALQARAIAIGRGWGAELIDPAGNVIPHM